MNQVKIGRFIAQLRQERGWTQEELGERLGVTNKTVSRWENGNYMPGVEMLTLLGKELEVSLNELIEGRRLEGDEFHAAAEQNLAAALEGPGERLRRWLERYGAFPAVTVLLCLLLAGVTVGMAQYRQAHPVDVSAVGSWCTDWGGTSGREEYVVLTRGTYYRYRQYEPLECGSYTVDGPVVTVETRNRRFQALVKGESLYVPDGEGKLTAYQKDTPVNSEIGVFINVSPEDFEK